MSYQVLARKWRPRRFAELVGQDHVVRALVNALDRDRLHHAFLFTGTRGVGKTTIARILAKSLNCETGVSSQPCGSCPTCQEVDQGRFVDLIEVDAASRTKVDDTRELLDNVQYAPTRGRYKVYLIDEVHMLSGHSFNALLKTLEEPPPHVKFLLATTDPQKLPVTVLSRCLQFNLKRLTPELITRQLEHILGAEGLSFEPATLPLLARVADGSMRDALSLLDQAIAYGGGRLAEKEVRDMLGSIDQDVMPRILAALAAGSGEALLAVTADLAQHSADGDGVLKELLLALHRIALAQLVPATAAVGEAQYIDTYARALTPEDVQLFYQIGLTGRRDLSLAPDPLTGLEMTLLRMLAFRPVGAAGEQRAMPTAKVQPKAVSARTQAVEVREPIPPALITPAPATTVPTTIDPQDIQAPATREPSALLSQAPVATPGEPGGAAAWAAVVAQLQLTGLARELANNTTLDRDADGILALTLDEAFRHLNSKERAALLKQALERYYGRPLELQIQIGKPQSASPVQERQREQDERQQAAVKAIAADPTVQALQEQFNARVNTGSIRPKI
jgi:DNA polymerase-3 subunit gamma/tau